MASLQGKVAIVTGAAKGIGAATALGLAAEGAKVVVNYLQAENDAQQVVGRIEAAGSAGFAVKADISKPQEIEQLFKATKERFGSLDILVNNAGSMEVKFFDEITLTHMDDTFGRVFKSVVLCTQAAAALFPASGGVVINISSEGVRNVMPGGSVFAATKSAVEVLSRNLAQELGPRNIRVACVAPGFTRTPATHWLEQSRVDQMVSRTALRRPGQATDIAPVVVFLASESGAWITGTTLTASGGLIL